MTTTSFRRTPTALALTAALMALSAGGAHWPVTRTQYDVVELGLTLIDWPVPNGVAVFGGEPMYHW